MTHTIAVLNDVHLLPKTEQEIAAIAGDKLSFPHGAADESEATYIARTHGAEVILVSPSAQITENYLQACPSVKYVGVCGTSTARLDIAALKKHGVRYTNVVDYGDEPAAEFFFMQLVSLARGVGPYQWRAMPAELMDKKITIVGLGALGQAFAHLALGYKMRVSYYSTHRKPSWEVCGLQYGTLNELLPTSDIVVICTPTDVQALDAAAFASLSDATILVQASIGNVFDEKSFRSWIAKPGTFALFDYSAGEQLYQKYKAIPKVLFPKVIAGHTQETRERLGEKVLKNLHRYYFEQETN